MREIVTCLTLLELGISAMLIVQPHIRVQRCFVYVNRLKVHGLNLNLIVKSGLVTLTCLHMEEGRAPSSIAGSQDALLTIPVDGHLMNQTMAVTMKIVHLLNLAMAHGMMDIVKQPTFNAPVSTPQF